MNIAFKGEIGDNQSWGISTIGNVQGFLSLGHNVCVIPMNRYGNVPDDIQKCIARPVSGGFDVVIRQGLAEHMAELEHLSGARNKVSLCCWDSDLITKEAADVHNAHVDAVFALSPFTKKAFTDAGVTIPIHVGGQGVDTRLFRPRETPKSKEVPYTFITVAVAQGRKGTQELITAFEKAFQESEKVQLIIKSNSWGTLKDFGPKNKNIKLVYEEYSRDQLAQLYRDSDCFVMPTHGDSFMLPGLEASASGIPLIITDFGGPTAYNNDTVGYSINYKLVDAGYLPGHQARPDIEHLTYLMRHVYENQEEAKFKGEQGARRAKEYWTWEKDAQRNIKFLEAL